LLIFSGNLSFINLKNKTPGEIRKTPEMVDSLRQISYSATALDTYLECPQKFCYRYLLVLEKKEEVQEKSNEPTSASLSIQSFPNTLGRGRDGGYGVSYGYAFTAIKDVG
jgi:hypothetical protein